MSDRLGRALAAGAGGFLEGVQSGMAEQAKAKREAARDRLRAEEAEKARTFRAGESEKDREFRTGQSEADREFRAGEGEKTRTHAATLATEAAAQREKILNLTLKDRREGSAADREFRAGEKEKDRNARAGGLMKGASFQDAEGYFYRFNKEGIAEPVLDAKGNKILGPIKRTGGSTGKPVEVDDPTSPTGRRYLSSDDAVGKPAPLSKADREARAEADEKRNINADAYAEQRVNELKSMWKSRETEFKDYGGSEAKAREHFKREFLSGGATREAGGKEGESSPGPETKAAPKQPPKPEEYPNAKWSAKANAWVIQKDGQWYRIK